MGEGVPTLDGEGYLPWSRGEGTYLGAVEGVPTLDGEGVPTLEGVPTMGRLCHGQYASCSFLQGTFLFQNGLYDL